MRAANKFIGQRQKNPRGFPPEVLTFKISEVVAQPGIEGVSRFRASGLGSGGVIYVIYIARNEDAEANVVTKSLVNIDLGDQVDFLADTRFVHGLGRAMLRAVAHWSAVRADADLRVPEEVSPMYR